MKPGVNPILWVWVFIMGLIWALTIYIFLGES